MKILYIPFSFEDSLSDLHIKARKWQKEYQKRGKEIAIIHHGDVTIHQHEGIQQALQAGRCQLYVLSHGMKTSELKVCNQCYVDESYRELTIEGVVERFKIDLMSSAIDPNNIIKLFFCDEGALENKPRMMAEKFREQLAEEYQNIEIKYYTDVRISPPSAKTAINQLMGAKKATLHFQQATSLFCFELLYHVGTPKLFRQGLNEAEKMPLHFFSSATEVIYPEFAHPLIRALADKMVNMIKSDKILSKYQDWVINELLQVLPCRLDDYLIDSLTIATFNLHLVMRINREQLTKLLISAGNFLANDASVSEQQPTLEEWVDPEDFLGHAMELEREMIFLALDDYDEVIDSACSTLSNALLK